MKRALAALLLCLAAPIAAQSAVRGDMPGWMAGTWMAEDGADWADELWTDPRGGIMLGYLREGFGPQLQDWQSARIAARPEGRISLFLRRGERAAVEFPLVLQSEEAVEFANPSNPYPQRIRWSRQGRLLVLEMSRIDGGDARRLNFRPVVAPQD